MNLYQRYVPVSSTGRDLTMGDCTEGRWFISGLQGRWASLFLHEYFSLWTGVQKSIAVRLTETKHIFRVRSFSSSLILVDFSFRWFLFTAVTKQQVSHSMFKTENFQFSSPNELPVDFKWSLAGYHILNKNFKIKFLVSCFWGLFVQVQHELFVLTTRKGYYTNMWKWGAWKVSRSEWVFCNS